MTSYAKLQWKHRLERGTPICRAPSPRPWQQTQRRRLTKRKFRLVKVYHVRKQSEKNAMITNLPPRVVQSDTKISKRKIYRSRWRTGSNSIIGSRRELKIIMRLDGSKRNVFCELARVNTLLGNELFAL